MSVFNFPPTWAESKIGELFLFSYGKALSKTNRNGVGNVPVFGSNGVTGYHDQSLIEGPCLLVGRKGAAGKVSKALNGCWPIDTTYYVEPPHDLDFEFCFHLFQVQRFEKFEKSTAIPSLSRDDAYEQIIALPPFNEQKRIVAKIEELFSELDAGEESLRKARRQLGVYRQSLLKQAFEGKLTAAWREQNPSLLESAKQLLARIHAEWKSFGRGKRKTSEPGDRPQIDNLPSSWVASPLGDFVSIERGRFSVRPRNDPRYYDGDVPFVQIGDLPREGGSITSYKQTLNEAGLAVSKLFPRGTPLVAIVGATIGNTGILSFDSCCPDSLVALVTEDQTIAQFVELYFRAHKGRIRDDSYASGGQPNINNAYLERQPIGVPPLAEQQEIVRLLDEQFTVIEQNEREIDTALKRSEALRQSILKKAFSGQLVPQDPMDEPAAVLLERIRKERDSAVGAPSRKRTANRG